MNVEGCVLGEAMVYFQGREGRRGKGERERETETAERSGESCENICHYFANDITVLNGQFHI